MDYLDKINSIDVIIGNRFKALVSNRNVSVSGFYLTLAERPSFPTIPPSLLDLNPQFEVDEDKDPITIKSLDQVEYIYFNSFKLDWIQVSTTKTYTGVELYINDKLLPPDYSISEENNKYGTWFLGYMNDMTGEILPCIYGYGTKVLIKPSYSNTISLDLDIKCNFNFLVPKIDSYINRLENNLNIDDKPDPLYYKLGELSNKILNSKSYSLSPGVGTMERGILKFK